MRTDRSRKWGLCRLVCKFVSVFTLFFFSAGTVFALPAGQQVVNGQATFATQGNNLTITNSPNAIIHWQGFSINSNEAVRFIQQYSSSAVLNRVVGQDPSRILGLLQSNGRVFLINPNGILFGQGARIDVNGLVASTLNIGNQDFLAGRYNFTAGEIAGPIQNQGTITTPAGGKVYLIAPDIENSGLIESPKGDVILAAGHSVQLVDSLDPNLSVVVSAPEDKAVNLGQIVARSGKVGIYGGLIEQKGIVRADSAVVGENGRIFFKASKDITLDTGSVTSAKGGGKIEVFGDMKTGSVTVNGALDASAPDGGDGGFIETSAAHVRVGDSARVTTLAPYGRVGSWLIDPTNYTIGGELGDISGAALGTQLGLGNVTIATDSAGTDAGDIFVDEAVAWNNANTLTLKAHNNININAPVTNPYMTSGEKVILRADLDANGVGTVNFPGGPAAGSVNTGTYGTVSIYYNPASYTAPTDYSGKISAPFTAYMLVNNVNDLQNMNMNLAGTYALGKNIDASETSTWNSNGLGGYNGFVPIGNSNNPFSGMFDGDSLTISNLQINRPNETHVGLFGYNSGVIKNVGLVGGSITGFANIGGLAGRNTGTIINSYNMRSVTASGDYVGGLVGDNGGAISNSYNTGAVIGSASNSYYVGGLAGYNQDGSSIDQSYNTGSVDGYYYVAGLAGVCTGCVISNSYNTGNVTGNWIVGGLMGQLSSGATSGAINDSYNTGGVSAPSGTVGGLVGANYATIGNSYSTGDVTGNTWQIGGLVGLNDASGNITNSYSTGMVNGSGSLVGGFVGQNNGTISLSYWNTETSGRSNGIGTGSSSGCTGLTTAQMKTQTSFAGWDFTNTWGIVEGSSYPYLLGQPAPTQQTIIGSIDAGVGKTIYFAVNGALLPQTATTGLGGFFSVTLPDNSVPTGGALLAYVANDATVKGASVYLAGGGNINNLLIESNTLIVSSGGGNISNTTLGTAKGGLTSGDIPYTFFGTNLTLIPNFHFKTASGTTYLINGNITTVNGSQTYNGPVTFAANAILRNTGTGNFTFGGPVTGTGFNFTLDAGAANDISMMNAGNNIGSIGIASGRNVSLKNVGALELGASTVSGVLDVTADGNLTQTGALAVGSSATLYAQGAASNLIINGGITKTGGSDTALLLKADNAVAVNTGAAIGSDAGATGRLDVTLNAGGNIALSGDVSATGGIEIHATGDVAQNGGNIANTISGATAPGSYDINISGDNVRLGSVASQRNIDVTAQSLTVGNMQALGAQGYHVDDEFFTYLLPFSFSFYGTPYSTAYISSNGIITFGDGTWEYSDSTADLQYYRIIASAWNDWDTRDNANFARPLDVYVSSAGGAFAVRWDVARYPTTSQAAQFETVLYNNGNFKFNYGPASTSFAGDVTIGLSNQSSESTLVSQLMSQPNFSMNNLRSTTFTYQSGSGLYSETLSAASDWNAAMPGSGIGGITGLGNIVLNSVGVIDLNGMVNAGSNLKLTAAGAVSQRAPISAAGLELLGTGATYNLTHTGNAIATLAGNTGAAYFTNSTGTAIGTVNNTAGLTTGGALTLTSNGAITQSAPLTVAGAATFGAGATNDINLDLVEYLGRAVNDFSSVGISSGRSVILRDSNTLALHPSTISSDLTVLTAGDILLGGLVNAGAGNVSLTTNGAIVNNIGGATSISAGTLNMSAMNGIGSSAPLMTAVHNLAATNSAMNNIEIDNTGVLAVSGLSNGIPTPGYIIQNRNVILKNSGAITTDTSTITSVGTVSVIARSPLTIGPGGVEANGSVSLEASPSGGADNLTVNGNILSTNGNILLSAGSSILGTEGRLSAPNGTITMTAGLNGSGNEAATRQEAAMTGNETATSNTVTSLMTAMAKITSDENGDDENELKKKSSGRGQQSTEERKADEVKNYCN